MWLLFICQDPKKDLNLEQIKQVAAEHGINQPIFVDSEHKLAEALENQYVPAYYVFDREGKLRHFKQAAAG